MLYPAEGYTCIKSNGAARISRPTSKPRTPKRTAKSPRRTTTTQTATVAALPQQTADPIIAPGPIASSQGKCAAFNPKNKAAPASYPGDAFYDISEATLYNKSVVTVSVSDLSDVRPAYTALEASKM